ncbi:MAG TPA: alpha/beta hydrolase [Bacteroidia bacterium]|nr:alpha/beta hydrolase [Bacteroidia bacterium]
MTTSKNINGLDINYVETAGTGLPVFFIHGNSAGLRVFHRQLNGAFGKRFRCIAFDMPGCGNSDRSADYSALFLARMIRDFILSFGFDSYAVVAHSLGGHLFFETQPAPGAKGVFLFGVPLLGASASTESPFLDNPVIPLLFSPDLSDADKALLIENFCACGSADDKKMLLSLIDRSDPGLRGGIGRSLNEGKINDEIAEFRRYDSIKQMMHCAGERIINGASLEQFASFCAGGKILVIEGASHYPQLENPSAFENMLGDFLGKLN